MNEQVAGLELKAVDPAARTMEAYASDLAN
jgi:hypothetical protein